MKNIMKGFALICFVVALSACQRNVATNEEGNALGLKYVTFVNEGKYDEAFALVSDDFFNTRHKDQWIEYYKAIKETMGDVISVKLSRHLVDDRFSGRFYMFQFSIKHVNGFTTEMVTMIQRINKKEQLKVFAHKVDSSKLRKINEMY